MLRRAALLFALTTTTAQADASLTELERQVTQAETQFSTLEKHLEKQQTTHKQQLQALHQQTIALLHLAQWPRALLITQSLAAASPNLPGLVSAGARQTHTQLTTTSKQLTDYLNLRQEAANRLATIHTLQSQLSNTKRNLTRQQEYALEQALIDAATLSNLLQQSTAKPVTKSQSHKSDSPPDPAKIATLPTLAPVTGQAVPAPGGGLHYLAPANAPIMATLPGDVIYSGPFRNLGGLVIIHNPGGLHTIYAGLGTLSVTSGQSLETGAEIGRLPTTTQPSPRLYYEVRRHGRTLTLAPAS